MTILRIYKQPALSERATKQLKSRIKGLLKRDVCILQTELCYYILTSTQGECWVLAVSAELLLGFRSPLVLQCGQGSLLVLPVDRITGILGNMLTDRRH